MLKEYLDTFYMEDTIYRDYIPYNDSSHFNEGSIAEGESGAERTQGGVLLPLSLMRVSAGSLRLQMRG